MKWTGTQKYESVLPLDLSQSQTSGSISPILVQNKNFGVYHEGLGILLLFVAPLLLFSAKCAPLRLQHTTLGTETTAWSHVTHSVTGVTVTGTP